MTDTEFNEQFRRRTQQFAVGALLSQFRLIPLQIL
jgi:hypothetical protein